MSCPIGDELVGLRGLNAENTKLREEGKRVPHSRVQHPAEEGKRLGIPPMEVVCDQQDGPLPGETLEFIENRLLVVAEEDRPLAPPAAPSFRQRFDSRSDQAGGAD